MARTILAIILGYSLWTALWLGGNALLFSAAADQVEAGDALTHAGMLLGVLGLSVGCSLSAGFLAAKVGRSVGPPITVMGFLLLLTGIMVQMTVWDLMPMWYHIVFLVLLLPMCRIGAGFTAARKSE
ncbi:MAG: hypothetical protein COA70_08860 [Planctomycetota bacterium]|nr:MAG: hypothetical protein COA70_08860 [Planctomycetota bacterium]